MAIMNVMKVAASGLHAQRMRMEVVSSNLANIHTTRGPDGQPFRRLVPVFRAEPLGNDFQAVLDQQSKVYGVEVERVADDGREPTWVFDPEHPDADERGFVAMPNINLVEEMTDMMNAARSYEANLSALQAAKSMAKLALNLAK